MKIIVLGVVAVLGLAGCTAQQIIERKIGEDPTIAQRPAAYRQGFDDGCQSGLFEFRGDLMGDKFVRDDARMRSDNDYALGWNDGARRCRTAK